MQSPSIEEWRNLYDAMAEVKKLAPWEYMEESEVFGVKNPETGEIGFISVMGMLGEHLAVALYPGARALYDFWEFEEDASMFPDVDPMRLLEIPQLQASFEDREMLEKEDRAVMKKLKLKFRGRQAWPQFRSYRPGFVPWLIEADEARFLTYALQQLVDVATRYQDDETLLYPNMDEADDEQDVYLVRVAEQTAAGLEWHDETVAIDEPEQTEFYVTLDPKLVQQAQNTPRAGNNIEASFFLLPAPIHDTSVHERPFFPYMLLMIESDSGMIVGMEMMHVEDTLEAMWSQVAQKSLETLLKVNIIPNQIQVSSDFLADLLLVLDSQLGIDVALVDHLPSLDEAKMAMMMQFSGGFG